MALFLQSILYALNFLGLGWFMKQKSQINISIFITSRVSGNANHGLTELIRSLEVNSDNSDQIEVLVKFDDDDDGVAPLLKMLEMTNISTRHTFGPRGRGYEDIHDGYSSLLQFASPESKIYICMADDFEVASHWDTTLREAFCLAKTPYAIVHQRPHPPSERASLGLTKYNPLFDDIDFEDLYIIDEAPAWSADLIKTVGSFGPISFTDLWTKVIEKKLFLRGLNLTYFTENEIAHRKLHPNIDTESSERWLGARKRNFDFAKTLEFKAKIDENMASITKALMKNPMNYLSAAVSKNAICLEILLSKLRLWLRGFDKYFSYESATKPTLLRKTNASALFKYKREFFCVGGWLHSTDLSKADETNGVRRFKSYFAARAYMIVFNRAVKIAFTM